MSTTQDKLNVCMSKFGNPWMLNTKSFGHPPYNASGAIVGYSPYVYLKGAEAVAALSYVLTNYSWALTPDLRAKYNASKAFAIANPTSLVPNPRFDANTTEFKPEEYQVCVNAI